jgi:outer membrane protein assembly factor BamB
MHRFAYALLSCCLAAAAAPADDWPQWLGPKGDDVWRETGLVEQFPRGGPSVRWRAPIGMGYAGPAVAAGRVYLLDRVLAEKARNPDNAFKKDPVQGKERVRCFDASNGKPLWEYAYDCEYEVSYPAGPRTTPTVHGGKVYTLGTMGDLYCLDAGSGKVVWSKNFPRDYKAQVPFWGYAGHPLLDGDRLICLVGAEDAAVVAFHKDTGEEVWKAALTGLRSPHGPGYCPASLVEAGGKKQVIVWLPEAVHALNPETGKPYWSEKYHVEAGMTIPVPRQSGDRLFFTCFYSGSMMLQLASDRPAETVLWKSKTWGAGQRQGSERPERTDGLHCVMSTPIFRDGYIYGICSHGELRCIDAATGKRVWESLKATGTNKDPGKDRWNNAFLVAVGDSDRFIMFNERGDLILARLTPKGYEEISRAHILEPTNRMAMGRPVVWSHPAFANKCVYARNDKELVCISLAAGE